MSLVFKTLIYRVKQFRPQIAITTTAPSMPSEEGQPSIHQTRDLITEQSMMQSLDDAIESTKFVIEKMEDSEQFLGTRIRRYRQMLAEHQMRIDKDYDVISLSNRRRHVEQQEKYQQQICDVIDIHRNILIELEILRRKLIELEKKQKEFTTKKDECEQYFSSTSVGDIGDDSSYIFEDNDVVELEMGLLNRVDPSHLQIS